MSLIVSELKLNHVRRFTFLKVLLIMPEMSFAVRLCKCSGAVEARRAVTLVLNCV